MDPFQNYTPSSTSVIADGATNYGQLVVALNAETAARVAGDAATLSAAEAYTDTHGGGSANSLQLIGSTDTLTLIGS